MSGLLRWDALKQRHVKAKDGDEYRHTCGCFSRVVDGKWVLITGCKGASKMGIRDGSPTP